MIFKSQAACIALSKLCALVLQLEVRLQTFRDLKQVPKLKASGNQILKMQFTCDYTSFAQNAVVSLLFLSSFSFNKSFPSHFQNFSFAFLIFSPLFPSSPKYQRTRGLICVTQLCGCLKAALGPAFPEPLRGLVLRTEAQLNNQGFPAFRKPILTADTRT